MSAIEKRKSHRLALKTGGALLGLVFAASMAGLDLSPPAPAAGYHLAFHDEFDSLDLSRDGTGNHTWYPNIWWKAKHSPIENISVSDGILTLVRRDGQGTTDTSIETTSPDGQYARAWRYGYFEVRMKWNVVTGAWPALWLIPVQSPRHEATYNGRTEEGEIDIFEGAGDHPSTFYGTIHRFVNGKGVENNGTHGENAFQLPAGTDLSQYHVYGVLWVPGEVTWYFDDRPLHSARTYPIFDKQDYFLVLTAQEGVNWKAGNMKGVEAKAMAINVDWVRVWQR